MPIKFRCQHCQQLLGISRSRAGAVVDCPQCGRSLRVPDLNGQIQAPPDERSGVSEDADLLNALSQLTQLSDQQTADRASERPSQHTPSHQPAPIDAPATVRPEEPQLVTTASAPVYSADGSADDTLAALDEIADIGSDADPALSRELLDEMRAVSHPTRLPLVLIFNGLFLLSSGFLLGWYFGQTHANNLADDQAAVEGDADSGAVESADVPQGALAESHRQISGTVVVRDAEGTAQPDTGALVLILPVRNPGTIRLTAQSFRQPAEHPEYRACQAALTELGGAAGAVDADGHFEVVVEHSVDAPLSAVIISSHQERPADVPVAANTQQILSQWFDSVSHICGRLSVAFVPLDDSDESLEIVFRK